jgi:hypothetical protein
MALRQQITEKMVALEVEQEIFQLLLIPPVRLDTATRQAVRHLKEIMVELLLVLAMLAAVVAGKVVLVEMQPQEALVLAEMVALALNGRLRLAFSTQLVVAALVITQKVLVVLVLVVTGRRQAQQFRQQPEPQIRVLVVAAVLQTMERPEVLAL